VWFCDEWCEVWCSVNIIFRSHQRETHSVENFPVYSVGLEKHFVPEYCHCFSHMNEIYVPCLMWWLVCSHQRHNVHVWPLPPHSDSSPPRYLPSRQPRLGNRSLFKSFMSTPQKRKACRKLSNRNEECVIVPLISDDLWHNGCNWFDNQFISSQKGRKLQSAILLVFLSFLVFCFTDELFHLRPLQ